VNISRPNQLKSMTSVLSLIVVDLNRTQQLLFLTTLESRYSNNKQQRRHLMPQLQFHNRAVSYVTLRNWVSIVYSKFYQLPVTSA